MAYESRTVTYRSSVKSIEPQDFKIGAETVFTKGVLDSTWGRVVGANVEIPVSRQSIANAAGGIGEGDGYYEESYVAMQALERKLEYF